MNNKWMTVIAYILWILVALTICSFPQGSFKQYNQNTNNNIQRYFVAEALPLPKGPSTLPELKDIALMINKNQLRATIKEVLIYLDESTKIKYSVEAEDLIMMVICHESRGGTWLYQRGMEPGKGGVGLTQMEVATEQDIHKNYLKYRSTLRNAVEELMFDESFSGLTNLQYNVAYQITMARIHFFRAPNKIPSRTSKNYLTNLAKLCKVIYNTHKGKATATKYLEDYKRYGV